MEYLKSLIKAGTLDSSKSFALVLSVLVGALVGLCVCFCLVWQGYTSSINDNWKRAHGEIICQCYRPRVVHIQKIRNAYGRHRAKIKWLVYASSIYRITTI